jgi:Cu/Ag efflux pump CusA
MVAAVVGFIALITCAVEAALLCKSRNKQISYMTID